MAFDYEGLKQDVVIQLLDEFGKSGTLLLPGAATGENYDPQPGADIPQPVVLLEIKFTKEERAGGNVETNDLMFLVSPKGVTVDPELTQRVQVGSIIYSVVGVKPLRPADVTMFWKIHAR